MLDAAAINADARSPAPGWRWLEGAGVRCEGGSPGMWSEACTTALL